MIFNLPTGKKHNVLVLIGLAAALIGFLDSLYLTITYYIGSPVVCSVIEGCNIVLASSWASFFGIPVAVIGLAYYALMFSVLIWYRYSNNLTAWSVILAVSTAGLIISFGLLYLQLVVIGAVCEYCLLSFVATICVCGSVLSAGRFRDDTIESHK